MATSFHDGFLSIVAPGFAANVRRIDQCIVHEYCSGTFRPLAPAATAAQFTIHAQLIDRRISAYAGEAEPMGQIRPETEADRHPRGTSGRRPHPPPHPRHGPDRHHPRAAATAGGQRLLATLVNILTRMKGVVREISLISEDNPVILPGTPLRPGAPRSRALLP